MPPSGARYVNLGCGTRFHTSWINIDLASADPNVIQHDLATGIPLDDESCEFVYSSAVLEHVQKTAAARFAGECYRVLRPGGVVRIGVPDLERIARLYLSRLEAATAGEPAAAADYDWLMLELYDQVVRERSGGAMLEFLRDCPPNRDFIRERIGLEADALLEPGAVGDDGRQAKRGFPPDVRRLVQALRRGLRHLWLRAVLHADEWRALKLGRFRLSGEVHQWMYDRFSLARLLRSAGFREVVQQAAGVSRLPHFAAYELEVAANGATIKPDLLYMEGIKPFGGD